MSNSAPKGPPIGKWPEDAALKEYVGGCHCGQFRYKFTHPVFDGGEWNVVRCNCSLCLKNGRLNVYVPANLFEFTKGSLEETTSYQFHKKILTHYFCPTCGVAFVSSAPGLLAVNVRSTDGIEVDKLQIVEFDGATRL